MMNCPDCGSVLKDWRDFSEKSEIDKIKPFECTGFRCGKRWKYEEILQSEAIEEGRKEE
ncbi:MAG: hypothetical protein SPE78_10065 [Actinobacillus minor]|nr:hypothetical protein [Actinobacillus minor]